MLVVVDIILFLLFLFPATSVLRFPPFPFGCLIFRHCFVLFLDHFFSSACFLFVLFLDVACMFVFLPLLSCSSSSLFSFSYFLTLISSPCGLYHSLSV
eukprot:m.14355 g.14355  ORF g.14355 m.14355 type:complete len:98 (-) comp7590_c0_seq1:1443-1736(-)